MRVIERIAALGAIVLVVAGCAGNGERDAVLHELSPAPMGQKEWAHVAGTYMGSVHESTERWNLQDLASIQMRIDLSGWTDSPGVVLIMDRGYSTAWSPYGEWKGTFTNIMEKRYGTQGSVIASTHAPNQMLIVLRKNGASPYGGNWLILTFIPEGKIQVNWLGHAGWHGHGELWRVPEKFTPPE